MKTKLTALAMGTVMMSGAAAPVVAFAAADTTVDKSAKDIAVEEATSEKKVTEVQSFGQVKHILVSGNEKVSSDEILKFVTETKVGEEYNRDVVTRDVQRIVNSGLVQSAKAKALQNNGQLYVVFEVEEMSAVKSVTFEGNTILSSEHLASVVALKEGDDFLKEVVRQDSERIRNAYAQQGFVAVVSGVKNNNGVVTYTVQEAKIGDIVYTGNEKTKNWVLDKLTGPYLQKGAFLRNDNLQAAYNEVANSGYFASVKINASDIPDQPGSVSLNVDVKETSTGAWNVGGAYSDTYGAELVGGIHDKNLGGSAKTVGFDFGIGTERDHYTLTFTDPYWKKSNTSVYAKAFKTDKDIDNDYFEYSEAHTGGEIGYTKPISRDNRTQMYANFRVDKIGVSEQKRGPELGSLQENSVTMGVVHDGRNMATGSGTVLEGAATSSLEVLGSDETFTKFVASAKSYKRLSDRDMLAARSVIQYSPDSLPGIEQFTIGGSDSVRGLNEDEQRGDKSLLGTVEYRHSFTDKLQGVVFADVGKAWSDEIDNDLKFAAGLGLRVTTALGVLRLDVAKAGDNSPKFLFGLGQSF